MCVKVDTHFILCGSRKIHRGDSPRKFHRAEVSQPEDSPRKFQHESFTAEDSPRGKLTVEDSPRMIRRGVYYFALFESERFFTEIFK